MTGQERCWTDAICMISIFASLVGWLPVFLASAASLAAAIHYSVLIYDRFHPPQQNRGSFDD